MSDVYTYRDGKKLPLVKKADQFVVRALPEQLPGGQFDRLRQVSTASTRIHVAPASLEAQMQQCRQSTPTHHAYVTEDDAPFLITDRVYIQFTDAASRPDIDALANRYGLRLLEVLDENEYLYQLTDATGMNPVKLVVRLTEDESALVALAENDLNYEMERKNLLLPTDSAYRQQWHLHAQTDHPEFDPRASSRCDKAWEYLRGYGSAKVVVGVTDDGCNLFHRDFDTENKFAGWGYFEGSSLRTDQTLGADPHRMYQPGANHGTACAGVIASEVDGTLTVGAAPGCRLLPIKWPSQGPSLFIGDRRLRKALNYMSDKVDVMSNSWGNPLNGNVGFMVRNKIAALSRTGGRRGKGIVFLWAAGNDNCPLHFSGDRDIPYTMGWERNELGRWRWVGPRTSRSFQHNLVDEPGVMYVAALASNARRSHYSNYGVGISICAPSSNSHAYHRLQVDGLGVTTVKGTTNAAVRDDFGGTSSATPLVAGVAALVISANPKLTALEVIKTLETTASKNLNMEGYPRTPPAAFDPDPSWDISPIPEFADGAFRANRAHGTWSPWFGYGKVDALAAVQGARPQPRLLVVEGANNETLSIPDADLLGVDSDIELTQAGLIESIRVRVDISHSYRSDLRVTLISPAGLAVLLHGNTGFWFDDIKETYTLRNTPGLRALVNESLEGEWTLNVVDSVGWDTGKLNKWSIEAKVLA